MKFHGNWQSHCNGHHGLLCARVVPQDCNTYRVTFSGTFLAVVPFVYTTPMTVTGRSPDRTVQLQGNANYQSESD